MLTDRVLSARLILPDIRAGIKPPEFISPSLPRENPCSVRPSQQAMGKAICYIIVASGGTSHYKVHKKLLQMYKKGEDGAFKSRGCGQNAHEVRTMFVV